MTAKVPMMLPRNACSRVVKRRSSLNVITRKTGNAAPSRCSAARVGSTRASGDPDARTSRAIEREPLVAYGR